MPKNRDYTGLVRTPSSMAWLIHHRAHLKGKLDRMERLESTLPEKIKAAKAELAAIDAVIPLHEVKVDPALIKGAKPKKKPVADYGVLSKFILRRLREAGGQSLYTTELALQFARENSIDLASMGQPELMDCVAKRLGALASKGLVTRHHQLETRETGRWSLTLEDD